MAQCTHFWVIESPEGPYSIGTCKRCGEERPFRNWLAVSRWEAKGGEPAPGPPARTPPNP